MSIVPKAALALLLLLVAFPAHAENVSILVPTAAGGGTDAYARTVARHIGKYLPDGMNVIVQNVPGAAGGKLCKYLLEVADDNKIGIVSPGIGSALLGEASHKDCALHRLVALGTGEEEGRLLVFREAAGIRSPDDLAAFSGTLYIASTARASFTVLMAKGLLNAYRIKTEALGAYQGAGDTLLAAGRGEADIAMQPTADFLRSPKKGMIAGCAFGSVVNEEVVRDPRTPGLPTCLELAKRRLEHGSPEVKVMKALAGMMSLGKPFYAPPSFPERKAALFRSALAKVHRDPGYLADAEKTGASGSFMEAEEYQERFDHITEELKRVRIQEMIDAVL